MRAEAEAAAAAAAEAQARVPHRRGVLRSWCCLRWRGTRTTRACVRVTGSSRSTAARSAVPREEEVTEMPLAEGDWL